MILFNQGRVFNKNGTSNDNTLLCGNMERMGECEQLTNYYRDLDRKKENNESSQFDFEHLHLNSINQHCK